MPGNDEPDPVRRVPLAVVPGFNDSRSAVLVPEKSRQRCPATRTRPAG